MSITPVDHYEKAPSGELAAPAAIAPAAGLLAPGAATAGGKKAVPNRWTVIFSFFAIYIIWGSTYLAIRYAVETIPPLYAAGMRHLAAGTILLLWCVARKLRPTAAQIRASLVIGFFFFLIGHGSLHWAERRVPSGLASLLVASEPIWVFLLSAAATKKWHWNRMLFAGVFLGLAGVAVLITRTAMSSGPGMLVSSLAILVGALSWAAGVVYSRRSKLSGHPLLLSALSLLSGSAMLLTTATIAGESQGFKLASVSTRSWMALAYLILFGSVVAFTAYNWLMEH